jgi:hypothetical protein
MGHNKVNILQLPQDLKLLKANTKQPASSSMFRSHLKMFFRSKKLFLPPSYSSTAQVSGHEYKTGLYTACDAFAFNDLSLLPRRSHRTDTEHERASWDSLLVRRSGAVTQHSKANYSASSIWSQSILRGKSEHFFPSHCQYFTPRIQLQECVSGVTKPDVWHLFICGSFSGTISTSHSNWAPHPAESLLETNC